MVHAVEFLDDDVNELLHAFIRIVFVGLPDERGLQPLQHLFTRDEPVTVQVVHLSNTADQARTQIVLVSTPNNERQIHEKHSIHDYFNAYNYKKFKLDPIGIFARIFCFRFAPLQ